MISLKTTTCISGFRPYNFLTENFSQYTMHAYNQKYSIKNQKAVHTPSTTRTLFNLYRYPLSFNKWIKEIRSAATYSWTSLFLILIECFRAAIEGLYVVLYRRIVLQESWFTDLRVKRVGSIADCGEWGAGLYTHVLSSKRYVLYFSYTV